MKHKFKIGDYVRILDNEFKQLNKVQKIVKIHGYLYEVDHGVPEYNNDVLWPYYEDEIQLYIPIQLPEYLK